MGKRKLETSYVTISVTYLGDVATCMKVETLLPASVELDITCYDTYMNCLLISTLLCYFKMYLYVWFIYKYIFYN